MLSGSARGLFALGVLVDANPLDFSLIGAPIPATLWANPAAGDTVLIKVSFDNGLTWVDWPLGNVTAAAYTTLNSGMTHIRGIRTAGAGVTSTFGVC